MYRVLKRVFFRSIFRDPRTAVAVGPGGRADAGVVGRGHRLPPVGVRRLRGGDERLPRGLQLGRGLRAVLPGVARLPAGDRPGRAGAQRAPGDEPGRGRPGRRGPPSHRAVPRLRRPPRPRGRGNGPPTWASWSRWRGCRSVRGAGAMCGGCWSARRGTPSGASWGAVGRLAIGARPRNVVPATATVAAVIVYFRSGRAVVGAVESLVGQGVAPTSVTVVANSPVPADIAAELADLGAVVVPTGGNVGFAAACNLGAAGTVRRLPVVREPRRHLRQGLPGDAAAPAAPGPERAVAPALRLPDGSVERSAKSRSYLRPGVLLARELGVGRALRLGSPAPPRRPRVVTAVSGACLLVPRAAFDRVGGFAEEFFLYGEDVDLCLRLRRVGCKVAVIPDARAVHASGTGSGDPSDPTVPEIKGREARRAHLLLLRRHRSDRAAEAYLAGLAWVLRARRLVRPRSAGDRAASKWVAEERRRRRSAAAGDGVGGGRRAPAAWAAAAEHVHRPSAGDGCRQRRPSHRRTAVAAGHPPPPAARPRRPAGARRRRAPGRRLPGRGRRPGGARPARHPRRPSPAAGRGGGGGRRAAPGGLDCVGPGHHPARQHPGVRGGAGPGPALARAPADRHPGGGGGPRPGAPGAAAGGPGAGGSGRPGWRRWARPRPGTGRTGWGGR